jgi:hypothetical protein
MNISTTTRSDLQSYARKRQHQSLDFPRIAAAAQANAPAVLQRLLPGGRRIGNEYVVRNPKRSDAKPGSFKVNLRSGRWADFASGERGGDLIALTAWLFGLRQSEAARRLAEMLHLHPQVRS